MPRSALAALAAAGLTVAPAFAAEPIGMTSVAIDGERPLSLSLWYPAASGGALEEVGGNAVFTGQPAQRDAPFSAGRRPVVLLSHGGLRSADDSGAWLGARLAAAGYVVIEVNGPRPEDASAAVDEIWRRPEDISRALDGVTADPALSAHIDADRIAVVGFALGGTAAVSVAGGRIDPAAYLHACDAVPPAPDCGWFEAQGVPLASVDGEELARPRHDPRVRAAVAIDPEHLAAFPPGTLASLPSPILLLALGADVALPETDAAALRQRAMPGAASDAFAVCTPAGPAILSESGADPSLCGDSPTDRQRVHDAIAGEVDAYLDELLAASVSRP